MIANLVGISSLMTAKSMYRYEKDDEEALRVFEAGKSEAPETATGGQTLEEVKQEFYAYLDSLDISAGLANSSITVRITDAAFEKMLVDPEYKQRMKDLCARDLCDPAWNRLAAMGAAPKASIITIDADVEEEYLASSFNGESDRSEAEDEDFWTHRTERHKELLEEQQQRADERRDMLALLMERAGQRKEHYRDQSRYGSAATAVGGSFAYASVASPAVTTAGALLFG